MKCPVCNHGLTALTAGDITVDACKGGCGGLWFDRYELARVDEAHETVGEELLEIDHDRGISIDLDARLRCPRGDDAVMMRYFFSTKRQVTVDECPECGGHWLDPGELATIRTEFASEAERKQAAQRYFSELFDSDLAVISAETAEELARARRLAYLFRFICPSYYIPGEQDWGAF